MEAPPHLVNYAKAAEAISVLAHRPIHRQSVHGWWMRRKTTGFPEKREYLINGEIHWYFDLDEVLEWYPNYVPSVGGRPKKNAEVSE